MFGVKSIDPYGVSGKSTNGEKRSRLNAISHNRMLTGAQLGNPMDFNHRSSGSDNMGTHLI